METNSMVECKHDWVGDDHCAYCRVEDLQAALAMIYDKWENGDDCWQDPDNVDGFLGKAFQLSDVEENQILALLTGFPPAGNQKP